MLFHVREVCGRHACRDDGMVVGHLARIEHLLALQKFLAAQRSDKTLIITKSRKDLRTLWVNIIAQECSINTRICCEFLLVERLDQLQCLVGRIAEFLVALNLKRRKVEQSRRCFRSVLLRHIGNGKQRVLHLFKKGETLFLARKLTFG